MRTCAFPLTNWVMGLSRPGGAVSPKLAECSTLYSVGLKSTSIVRPFALPARTSTVALVSCWRTTTSRSPAALALGAGALLEPAPELPVELIDVDGRVRGGSVHRGHRRRGPAPGAPSIAPAGRRWPPARRAGSRRGPDRADPPSASSTRRGDGARRRRRDHRCAAARRPIAESARSRVTHRMRGGSATSSPPRRRGPATSPASARPGRLGARSPVRAATTSRGAAGRGAEPRWRGVGGDRAERRLRPAGRRERRGRRLPAGPARDARAHDHPVERSTRRRRPPGPAVVHDREPPGVGDHRRSARTAGSRSIGPTHDRGGPRDLLEDHREAGRERHRDLVARPDRERAARADASAADGGRRARPDGAAHAGAGSCRPASRNGILERIIGAGSRGARARRTRWRSTRTRRRDRPPTTWRGRRPGRPSATPPGRSRRAARWSRPAS